MAVAFDASMTGGNDGGDVASASAATSISSTGMTVGSGATLLIVTIGIQANSATHPSGVSVTWDGGAMSAGPNTLDGSQNQYSGIFYLKNPTAGNKTIAGSWTGAGDCYMSAISFTSSDTSGVGIVTADSVTSSEPSNAVTITTASGDATVATSCNNSNDPTTSQTKFWGAQDLNPGGAGSYNLSTGSSDVHSFTYSGGNAKTQAGVHIPAASGGGATPVVTFRRKVQTRQTSF